MAPVTNVRPVAAHVQRDGDHPVGEGAACRVRGDRVAPSVGHSIAAQVRSAGPGRRLPSASSRSLSRANPSPPRLGCTRPTLPLGLHGGGVAWPVRQLIRLFRRAHRVGRASGPMVPRESGTTALPVGAPGGGGMEVQRRSWERRREEEAGHERDAGRKGGPGHRWRIRDRPRQCFGACARRQLPSTSSPHRAGQSVPPTASPSTPSSASQ